MNQVQSRIGGLMNAAVKGIFEKDIVRLKREAEVPTEKLPTLSAKLVPQDD